MQVIYNSAKTSDASRAFHVVLYALIPEDHAYRPIPRGLLARWKNRLRRAADLYAWKAHARWDAHYSSFKDRANTNRGDIAIRMGVKRQLEKAFGDRLIKITQLPWGELGKARDLSPDLVVIAGGGFLFADREGRLPARFADDVRAIRRLSCPVVACSIGLNWLIDRNDVNTFAFHPDCRDDIRGFLERMTLVSVRDEATQRALAAVDGRTPPVIVDPGFLVADPPAQRTPNPAHPLEIGLNLAFHGAATSLTSQRMLPLMVAVCRRLQRELSCRFTYFVHSDGEAGIAAALTQAGLPLTTVNADVPDMLAAYRKIDIHVGQMLHSAILAMSVGTPALSLAYDVKSAGFYDLLGLGELCLDAAIVTEDEVVAIIKSLTENRHEVSAMLAARRTTLESKSHDFYGAIVALAEPNRDIRTQSSYAPKISSGAKRAAG